MRQTVIEKLAQSHMLSGPEGRPVRAGDFLTIRPRHVMTHDNTAAVLNKFRGIGAEKVFDPDQPVFTLDHNIQDRSEANLAKYQAIEDFAASHGVTFYPAGSGIGHQMMIENGHVLPGSFVVASDSHSNMYGAIGALGTPVVRTDAAAIWATGEFWWQIPRTVEVRLTGSLEAGVSGKDVIITLCGLYNQGEVLNAAIEFSGEGVESLSMDARMTISNMTTEWGALVGWFPVDESTIAYLRDRKARGATRITDEVLEEWAANPPRSDVGASYAARIELDLSEVTPHVSGPDSVQVMTSLSEVVAKKVPVHKAYLLSCVNSRYEDLAAAARVMEGRQLAEGVEFYVAAASREIEDRARESGVWSVFESVGARFLSPGCGPCIGLGTGLLEAGEVGISATNRNFKGRMGSRDAKCYLASPVVVAASALAGVIEAPVTWESREITRAFEEFDAELAATEEKVEVLSGFPETLSGRLVFLPQDNLNTDGIYSKDYTYREDVTREEMARVVMENYDPRFAETVREGDIVVGQWNFGTGSSREQAVTALQAKGIPLVIAGSFSQTYLRNAFNNGFLCVANPGFVQRVQETLAPGACPEERTLIPGDEIEVDFSASRIRWRGDTFAFPALGVVPQSLVIAGGVENQVRQKLGLA